MNVCAGDDIEADMGSVWRFSLLASVVLGCGSDHHTPADGSTQPPQDGPIDAPPDGPAASSAFVVNDGVGTITAWTAPSAYPTTSASGRLFVYNTGTATSAAVAPTITGTDAASFTIDAANTTCGTPLAGHDGCWIQLAFGPATAGTKTATLAVAGGGDPVTVALTGLAPPGPTGLTADVAALDFGLMNRNESKQLHVLLENVGTTTITLGARTASVPFQYNTDDCGATLTPGGACTLNISFTSASLGHFTGTLDVASDANALHLPLDATNLRLIQITAVGDGTGTVTSLPSGISCPGTCAAGFPGGIPVDLTASVTAANVFSHWAGICTGSAATCTIPPSVDGYAVPRFSLASDKKIHIAFAGGSPALASVEHSPSVVDTCTSDCDVYVASGTSITLRGYSASTFGGWSGDCVSATSDCSLGTIINNRTVTITSNPDLHEAATLSPTLAVNGLAVTSTGDLIIGSPADVSKTSITGTVAWTTALSGGVHGLALDATDEIFALQDDAVVKLSAAGAVVWSISMTPKLQLYANNPSIAVSPDGTIIAVLTTGGMRVLDSGGATRFEITTAPNPSSVAVAADGTIALGQDNPVVADTSAATRYTASGTVLAPFAPLDGTLHPALMYGPSSTLCVLTLGENSMTTSRVTSAGTVSYYRQEGSLALTFPFPSGVLATPTGECGQVRRVSQQGQDGGVKLDVWSSTGTLVYSFSKQPSYIAGGLGTLGLYATWVASGGTNRIAIGGVFMTQPWIQVLDLP